jgi:sulfur-oxidizing protein SoxY
MDKNSMSKQTRPRRDRSGQTRRTIIRGALAGGLAGLGLAGAGPLSRARAAADAGKWPKDAFQKKTAADALEALYGEETAASDEIKLDAPEIAENGAVVPISVSTTLADATSIALVVSENPFPLAAVYKIPPGTSAMVANRLKMAKTSEVVALVESGGKVFRTSKEVKVTVGGCGG